MAVINHRPRGDQSGRFQTITSGRLCCGGRVKRSDTRRDAPPVGDHRDLHVRSAASAHGRSATRGCSARSRGMSWCRSPPPTSCSAPSCASAASIRWLDSIIACLPWWSRCSCEAAASLASPAPATCRTLSWHTSAIFLVPRRQRSADPHRRVLRPERSRSRRRGASPSSS